MAECKRTRQFCTDLRKCRTFGPTPMVFNNVANVRQFGWPDRYISHFVFTGWVEFKDHNTPTKGLQIKIMQDLNVRHWCQALLARFSKCGKYMYVCAPDGTALANINTDPIEFLNAISDLQIECSEQTEVVINKQTYLLGDLLISGMPKVQRNGLKVVS